MILGIESSCDESALALYDPRSGLIGEWIHSQIVKHSEYGGVVPDIAVSEHLDNFSPLLSLARKEHNLARDVSKIAVTYGPGLVGCLGVGISVAKSLGVIWDIPVVGVNHLRGHAYSPFMALPLENDKSLREYLPHLGLLVSGGNTVLFSLNEKNQLIFSPTNTINYLTSSFGLTSFESNEIARTAEKVIPLVPVNQPRKTPVFIKYAAAAAVFLAFGYVGWTGYENKQDQLNFAKDQKQLEQKIQTATFVIESPLATIELNVDKELPKPYHVIAGAFQFTENAEKKVNQLKAKGFKAIILGKNKWGLTQVAYASFYKKTDAFKSLASVRKTDSRDAWLLVKKFD